MVNAYVTPDGQAKAAKTTSKNSVTYDVPHIQMSQPTNVTAQLTVTVPSVTTILTEPSPENAYANQAGKTMTV